MHCTCTTVFLILTMATRMLIRWHQSLGPQTSSVEVTSTTIPSWRVGEAQLWKHMFCMSAWSCAKNLRHEAEHRWIYHFGGPVRDKQPQPHTHAGHWHAHHCQHAACVDRMLGAHVCNACPKSTTQNAGLLAFSPAKLHLHFKHSF
jgi:hypothetical protein